MYLTDKDLLHILKKCVENVNIDESTGKSGLIVIKENVKESGYFVDKDDNCIIRSHLHFAKIFEAVGLEILHKSY